MSGEPTGGTFKLSWARDGWSEPETTAALPYNATPAEVESALLDLGYLEPGDVSVRGEAGDWVVLFEGRYIGAAEPDLPSITVTENNLTGGTSPEVSQHTPAEHLRRQRHERRPGVAQARDARSEHDLRSPAGRSANRKAPAAASRK